MRTIFLGASRRRETNETVRRRLTALFATAVRGGTSGDGGPDGPEPPPGAAGGRAGAPAGPAGRPEGANSPAGRAVPDVGTPAPTPTRPAPRIHDHPRRGRAVQDGLVRDGPPADGPLRHAPAAGPATGARDDGTAAAAVIRAVAVAAAAAGAGADATADPGGWSDAAGASGATGPSAARQPRRLPFTVPAALMLDRRAALGLAALLLLAVGYAVQHFWLNRPEPVAVPAATATGSAPPASHGPSGPPGAPAPTVVVDVAGKVEHPGLRTLPTGSRVADALRAAGGALPGIATDGLNLARVLSDGEQILVGTPTGQGGGGSAPGALLSLNQATLEQLDALPGVGPTLAQRILQYRRAHGPFRAVDQLHEISGIGPRKYEEIKDLLTL